MSIKIFFFNWRHHRCFPPLMLWSSFPWVTKIQSVLLAAKYFAGACYLYWQINDSRWDQESTLSHQSDCSFRKGMGPCGTVRVAPLSSVSLSKLVRGNLASHYTEKATCYPHNPTGRLSSHLVFSPRAGFWAKMFCQSEFFLALCKEIILSWKPAVLLILIPIALSVF